MAKHVWNHSSNTHELFENADVFITTKYVAQTFYKHMIFKFYINDYQNKLGTSIQIL